jgi:hypothetical protein
VADREELTLLSENFTGDDREYMMLMAEVGNDEKVKSVLYEALEKQGGRSENCR